ncbi:MAG TPA: PEP-CTERM sorting domain-containing protein [Gemmatales bacterium]|nr:PEP-CTERM sorting domain-containing protein [Gemmatales bacterium]
MRLLLSLFVLVMWLPGLFAQILFVSSYNGGQILRYDISGTTPVFNYSTSSAARQGRTNLDFSGGFTQLSSTNGIFYLDLTRNSTHLFSGLFGQGIYRSNLDGSSPSLLINTSFDTDGVRIGPDGFLYVVNSSNGQVLRYNPASPGSPTTFITSSVTGIASQMEFGPDGRVYVSRTIAGQPAIYRYTPVDPLDLSLGTTGEQLFSNFGSSGSTATGIRFGPDGRLYANDFNNSSVWRSDASLSLNSMQSYISSGANGLNAPGSLYIVAVPEPATLILFGIIGSVIFGILLRYYRIKAADQIVLCADDNSSD